MWRGIGTSGTSRDWIRPVVDHGMRRGRVRYEGEGASRMTRRLLTPRGYIVEDRPDGLYLLGDYMEAMGEARAHVAVSVTPLADSQGFSINLGYSNDPADGWAEWGTGPDLETAWRYALGSHFGSSEDPEYIGGRVE